MAFQGSTVLSPKYVITSATEPINPTTGLLWFDTDVNQLYTYNGSSWDAVNVTPDDVSLNLSVGGKIQIKEDAIFQRDNITDATEYSASNQGSYVTFVTKTHTATRDEAITHIEVSYQRKRNTESGGSHIQLIDSNGHVIYPSGASWTSGHTSYSLRYDEDSFVTLLNKDDVYSIYFQFYTTSGTDTIKDIDIKIHTVRQ